MTRKIDAEKTAHAPNATNASGQLQRIVLQNSGNAESVVLPNGFDPSDVTYVQNGADLVVVASDGRQTTLVDFFGLANAPVLSFGNGAVISGEIVTQMALGLNGAQLASLGGLTPNTPVGMVDNIDGAAFVLRADGMRETLLIGSALYEGDVVETGAGASLGLVFADETTFSMGEDGRMVLDELVYDPDVGVGKMVLSVSKGIFTVVSGAISKTDPDAMVVKTPFADIGIRGTQVGINLEDGNDLQVVIMEEGNGQVGEIVLTNAGGTQVINAPYQLASVTSFEIAPTMVGTIDKGELIDLFGGALQALPTHVGTGNDYGQAGPGKQGAAQNPDGPEKSQPMDDGYQVDTPVDTVLGPSDKTAEPAPPGNPSQAQIAERLAAAERDGLENDRAEITSEVRLATNVLSDRDGIISGSRNYDRLEGSSGDDVLYGGDDPDIYRDTERDWLSYDWNDDYNRLDGLDGDDILIGGSGNNRMYGGEGDDIIYGGNELAGERLVRESSVDGFDDITAERSGYQFLSGGAGDDMLVGGAGDNELHGGDGNDVIIGGERLNTSYSQNVSSGTNADGSETFWRYQNESTWGNQSMHGGDGNDVLLGGYGDNQMYGDAGDDILIGAEGYARSGCGNQEGWDPANEGYYDSSWAHSRMEGGAGDDLLVGGVGTNYLDGGDGDDVLYGGGQGNQSVNVTAGVTDSSYVTVYSELYGGSGNDTLNGGAGDNYMDGGDGDDVLIGGKGYAVDRYVDWQGQESGSVHASNNLKGGDGDDHVTGGDGYNQLYGGQGDDVLVAGSSNDSGALGQGGASYGIWDWAFQQTHRLSEADVRVHDNLLDGGAGDDELVAGLLNDIMAGGAGADIFDMSHAGGEDRILDFGSRDRLVYEGADTDQVTIIGSDGGARIEHENGSSVFIDDVSADGYSIEETDEGLTITFDV